MKKIFGAFIFIFVGVLTFFSVDCFANYAIGLVTGDAVFGGKPDIKHENYIEVYQKEIANLKLELNECKKIIGNNAID